ncbi:hypothetical protein HDE_01572 [Halotydeus destructor]|nr:hypothetical protein HDE_01572 [Halotydeus destructor]
MLPIIWLMLTSNMAVGQNVACNITDTLGPGNILKRDNNQHSSNFQILIEKQGIILFFDTRREVIRLRLDNESKTNVTRTGIFTEKNFSTGKLSLYTTNGTVTCRNSLYFKINGECDATSKRFYGLTDFCRYRNISRISGTQLENGMFLFSVHVVGKFELMEYYQVLLRNDGSLQDARQLKHTSPTALTSIRLKKGQVEVLLVAFDELVGLYDYDSILNSELMISRKIDYRSSHGWLGCEPDFCFDASIDGATAVSSDEFVLRRGNYVVDLQYQIHSETSAKFWIDSIEKISPLNDTSPVWSFITSRDDLCAIASNTTTAASCGTLFENLSLISSTLYIDAIFMLPNAVDIYVVRGDQYILYHTDQSNFTYKEHGFIHDLYSGLPDKIDGATQHKEYILFIQDNFVHWAKVVELKQNATVFKTTLVQEIFENGACDDDFYANSGPAQTLDISTFKEFKEYRMPSSITTTTVYTAAQSSTLEPKRYFFTYILFAVIVGLILLIIITICYIMKSTKSGDEVAMLSPFLDDTATNTSHASVSQASVTADA